MYDSDFYLCCAGSAVVSWNMDAASAAGCSASDYSDVESNNEVPDPKRSRKLSGAATYKTKFNKAWINEFPFISSVQRDPYR